MVLALLLTLGSPLVADLRQDDPEAWIRQLGSDSASDREAAGQALLRLGSAAIPILETAAKGADVDLSIRLGSLLRVLRTRDRLTPNLRKVFPRAEDRLLSGGDPAWTDLFLEAVDGDGPSKRKHPERPASS